jgi:fructose-bisphosphate aldolase, class I
MNTFENIQNILKQNNSEHILSETTQTTFERSQFTFPSPHFIQEVFTQSNRNNTVLRNLNSMYQHGRLSDTGYLSILPVDQGVEHSAGARFADNPLYFDPENIVKLAIDGGCSAVVSTLGALGLVSRKYAWQIPFIVKVNHNEFLTYPNTFDEVMFAEVEQAHQMGAVGIGATIYFGSNESKRQIVDVSKAFKKAHDLGMFTILWCYLRNDNFIKDGVNYHYAADLTGQANYLGVTIEADIIKQKPPKLNGGYHVLNSKENPYGASSKAMDNLTSDSLIDMTRYQLANCFMGKIPLINSGDPSGANDMLEATKAAVINKRAGGSGLIMGRKAFQKPFGEGVEILKAVQDVYLCKEITIA